MTNLFKKSRVTALLALSACAVLAGCVPNTTGPHPVNQPAAVSDGKDSGKIKATTTGPHPAKK